MTSGSHNAVERFIERWQSASGSERANYQLFVHELCALLDLPAPEPTRLDKRAIVACFTGRGTWKKRLPQIIDMLVAVGCVCRGRDGLAVTA